MGPRPILLGLVLGLALGTAGCGAEDEQPAGAAGEAPAQLVVRVDADGRGPAAPRELRLRCDSARESSTCAAADALEPADFAPPAAGTACTDIFGGPETARVSGRLHGEAVDARFSRSNGCEIERWDRVAGLLARVG